MSLPVDLVSLVLYCVQQLGVVLGVGAQTVLLVSFLIATRDGEIDAKEEQFGRAVTQLLKVGILLIISSGIFITAIHITFGELVIVETPAFLFKWAMIGVISVVVFFVGRKPYAHFFWEGILGAHWYALFIIHVLAPLIAWPDLIVMYLLWTVGFILAWGSLVYSMRAKHQAKPIPHGKELVPEPKIIVLPKVEKKLVEQNGLVEPTQTATRGPFVRQVSTPPPPKIAVPPVAVKVTAPPPPPPPKAVVAVPHKPEELPPPQLPAVIKTAVVVTTPPVLAMPTKPQVAMPQKPPSVAPQKPIEDPDAHVGLPTIRVMPQTPQDVDRQMRASSVQFE